MSDNCQECDQNYLEREEWFANPDEFDRPPRLFHCFVCHAHLEVWVGMNTVTCDRCDTDHNASGQALREGWHRNPSNWDSEISDMDGYEMASIANERF